MSMIDRALKDVRDEMWGALDKIGHYDREVRLLEPILSHLIVYEKYQNYWDLHVTGSRLSGIFICRHLKVDESFHALTPLLEAIVELGWMPKGTDDFYGYAKTYAFQKRIEIALKPITLYLNVRAFPDSASKVCQKVQVGTEPKYELQCVEVNA